MKSRGKQGISDAILRTARERYWKWTGAEIAAGVRDNTFSEPDSKNGTPQPEGEEFIASKRSGDRVAFFEHDGLTGYLYVFVITSDEVTHYVQVYTCVPNLEVCEADVEVVWSADRTKCGVVIWGEMRGIIDIANDLTGRATISSRLSPGVNNLEWLRGFDGFDGVQP